jgi:hypothetical protein
MQHAALPLSSAIRSAKPCDSVEVCGEFIACSTYELRDGIKTGAVELYRVSEGPTQMLAIDQVDSVSCDAVFDSKWAMIGPSIALLSVTSAAGLVTSFLESPGRLRTTDTHRLCSDASVSCLSIDMLSGWAGSHELDVIVSRSDGMLSVCKLVGSVPDATSETATAGSLPVSSLEVVHTVQWAAHSYAPGVPAEVWCASWRPCPEKACGASATTVVWSGGDDALLKGWDVRWVPGTPVIIVGQLSLPRTALYSCRAPTRPTFTCTGHGAGVCCIAWHPQRPGLACTGSYDEKVGRLVRSTFDTTLVDTAVLPWWSGTPLG